MSLRTARALTGTYFGLMLFFVTWPGFVPFAGPEPFVLGLPFSLAWVAGWIAGSVIVLTLLDRVEKRYRDAAAGPNGSPVASGGPRSARGDR